MIYSQPGIINVGDTGQPWSMTPNVNTVAVAQANAVALQNAIAEAQAFFADTCPPGAPDFGAIILFPSNDLIPSEGSLGTGSIYYIACQNNTPYAVEITCNWPILFLGTSAGVELRMIANTSDLPTGDMFRIDLSGGEAGGGIAFQDLQIKYYAGAPAGVAAINVMNGQNTRLFRVNFTDCPIGVWLANALQCTIFDCVFYSESNIGTGMRLGDNLASHLAKEIYIAGCIFLSTASGGVGLLVEGSDHLRVADTRIDGYHNGIQIIPGGAGQNAIRHHFTNVTVYTAPSAGDVYAGTALTIQPQTTNQQISNIVFEGCHFEPAEGITVSDGPGILIDAKPPDADTASIIETVRFVSCQATLWTGPGMQINSGQNIEILGGMYSGNASSGSPPAGISINGPAERVRIIGVSCVGKYEVITNGPDYGESAQQQVGIYIDQGATDVIVHGCDLTNNAIYGAQILGETGSITTNVFIRNCDASGYGPYSDAVNVSGVVSNVQITNCAGYNDQTVEVTFTPPSSTTRFNGTTFGYYGPTTFYVSGSSVTGIKVASSATATPISTGLLSGAFRLDPGEWGEVDHSGTVTFVLVGT